MILSDLKLSWSVANCCYLAPIGKPASTYPKALCSRTVSPMTQISPVGTPTDTYHTGSILEKTDTPEPFTNG